MAYLVNRIKYLEVTSYRQKFILDNYIFWKLDRKGIKFYRVIYLKWQKDNLINNPVNVAKNEIVINIINVWARNSQTSSWFYVTNDYIKICTLKYRFDLGWNMSPCMYSYVLYSFFQRYLWIKRYNRKMTFYWAIYYGYVSKVNINWHGI